jgi:RimJ/RimL family protein N-acetyltransferase
MQIREATKSDASAMLDLFYHLDSETDFMLMEPGERCTTLEEQQNIITTFSESRNRFMFVAEQDSIIGFCVLVGNQYKRTSHVASLVVGVCKIHWGQGIGSALLKQALQQATVASISRIELSVREDNVSAIALYEKFGFVKEGVRTHSLQISGKPANEIYMAKLLRAG